MEDEILDEKEKRKYNFLELIRILLLKIFYLTISFTVFWIIINFLSNKTKTDFPILGIIIFILIIFNSRTIANRYFNDDFSSLDFKLSFVSGFSVLLGFSFFNLILEIYFHFHGVRFGDLIPVVLRSIILSIFAFLFTLARIRELDNRNYARVYWSIGIFFILLTMIVQLLL